MKSRALMAAALSAALAAAAACSNEPAPRPEPSASAQPQPAPAPMAPSHSHEAGAQPAGAAGDRKPYDGPLPPLPEPGFTPPRSPEIVRATYEFAARRPDVLQYVPCFCGCERSGHVGNDDCFVSSRDAGGRPTWDLHGMG